MKSKYAIAWLLSYISVASVSSAIITPALPRIQTQFSLSLGAVEWMVSAFLIGYVVGQLLYGPLANAYGRLKALRLGLSLNLFGLSICLITAFYGNYPLLVLGRLITGLGAASGLTCTFMLINEWLPEEQRKTAMAYAILSFALGLGFSVMMGAIITAYWQWEGCFVFLMGQGLLMLWGLRVFDETLHQPKPIKFKILFYDYINALSSLKLVVFSMFVGTCSAIGYCFSAAGPQIAHGYLHISVTDYGYWNGLNIIGMLAGGLSARELLQYLSIPKLLSLGFLGCSAGILSLLWLWQTENHSAIWFFITTASLYIFASYFFAAGSYIASNALEDKATASSMMNFINMGFATLCVIAMGYLSQNPLIAFILILSLVFFLMLGLLRLVTVVAVD